MDEKPEIRSSTHWGAKDTALEAYNQLLLETKAFSRALSVGKGLRKIYHPFKSQLYVFHDAVRGMFDLYLNSKEFKEKKIPVKPSDYDDLAFQNPSPKKLILLKDVILDWAQIEGPYATNQEKMDSRQGWR